MARDQQRGRGRFQGRGGRSGRGGGRRNRKSGPRTTSPAAGQQRLLQFSPNLGGKQHTATYATVKEAIIQYIQRTFKDGHDTAESIENGVLINLDSEKPKREISKETDPVKAQVEQAGLDIMFQAEVNRFTERRENLRQNMVKAYALIFCNLVTKQCRQKWSHTSILRVKLRTT